ncbi:SPOSA6832_02980 [Sporobolomyces salmonicolor]|uniref:SPOSA6832_02980-mRNA-1:cds n=1 Tax=Sporidiobolus salmonicolor TaxID=5005 RepID=A0A0D6ENG1_SPOSA|nr:SPOSA6832_02980 [Sporobolomyces salmonicolor]
MSSAVSNGNSQASHTPAQPNPESFFEGPAEFEALLSPPKFDSVDDERAYLKERLAAALRIFGKYGYDHHIAGHLTVRRVCKLRKTRRFAVVTISDLILVNEEGEVIGGGKPGRRIVNKAGFLIHSSIHKARPDVQAICHSHSVYGKAFSTLGKPASSLGLFRFVRDLTFFVFALAGDHDSRLYILSPSFSPTMVLTFERRSPSACSFYDDIALLTQFDGVVLSREEGGLIAQTLGNKKAIILQNHGILTVGTTLDAAVAWYILLETQCQVQLLADAACAGRGPNDQPKAIEHEDAVFTAKQGGSEKAGYLFASPYFQVIETEEGDKYRK